MKINLTLKPMDPDDVDAEHSMGITSDAYDNLTEALMQAGFEIVSGPTRLPED